MEIDIDNPYIRGILTDGTIAGDDTIFIVVAEGVERSEVMISLSRVVPDLK